LYATIRLIVATHQVTIQFERRPYSILPNQSGFD